MGVDSANGCMRILYANLCDKIICGGKKSGNRRGCWLCGYYFKHVFWATFGRFYAKFNHANWHFGGYRKWRNNGKAKINFCAKSVLFGSYRPICLMGFGWKYFINLSLNSISYKLALSYDFNKHSKVKK